MRERASRKLDGWRLILYFLSYNCLAGPFPVFWIYSIVIKIIEDGNKCWVVGGGMWVVVLKQMEGAQKLHDLQ